MRRAPVPLLAAACLLGLGGPSAATPAPTGSVERTGCFEQFFSTPVPAAVAQQQVPDEYTVSLDATGQAALAVVTSACDDGGTLAFFGIRVAPRDAADPLDVDDPTGTPPALRDIDAYLVRVLTDDRRLRRLLVAARLPVTYDRTLQAGHAQCRSGSPAPLLCDVRTASRSRATGYELTTSATAVLTPPHRHDVSWWQGVGADRRRALGEHASTTETASHARFAATGRHLTPLVGTAARESLGFVQGPVAQRTSVDRG